MITCKNSTSSSRVRKTVRWLLYRRAIWMVSRRVCVYLPSSIPVRNMEGARRASGPISVQIAINWFHKSNLPSKYRRIVSAITGRLDIIFYVGVARFAWTSSTKAGVRCLVIASFDVNDQYRSMFDRSHQYIRGLLAAAAEVPEPDGPAQW